MYQETLNPLGVMVVVEAKHMCMQMRGVEKQNCPLLLLLISLVRLTRLKHVRNL